MYKVACPGCGADVVFKSAASVLCACEYCETMVLRTDEGVRDLGKRAALFEDYSPIQLGTTGVYAHHAFTVVGRIQMRFEAGFWNEWYVLFDDNTGGWFSDASGQYTILREAKPMADAPAFVSLAAGAEVQHCGVSYTAADVREAKAGGFEGELPFALGSEWTARVADCRHGDKFLTLDYSDSETPQVFIGDAVRLKDLKLQLLREDAGGPVKLKASVKSVLCPNCGSSLSYVEGAAALMHCGSCQSEITCTNDVAEVLQQHKKMKKPPLTLHPGDEGTFSGVKWRVLGAMTRQEIESGGERWTEYLLHNKQQGFLWLVETSEGWSMTQVLDFWPKVNGEVADLGNEKFKFAYEYDARVEYVVGAFNWKVQVGDVTTILSYHRGSDTLDAELSDKELTWSRSKDVETDVVLKAFNRQTNTEAYRASENSDMEADFSFLRTAQVGTTIALLMVLFFALITGRSLFPAFLGMVMTWLPFTFQEVQDALDK